MKVSVIVPVRDRAELLARTLEGLRGQTFADVEVIVIDDGSTDGSAEVAEHAPGLDLRLVRTPGVGALAARLAGIEVARGDVLAFTDSDCVPEPDWLHHGVAAIDKGADVAQGTTVPDGPVGAFERSVSHHPSDGLFPTCNVFYTREAYDRAGGFDATAADRLGFRTPGGRALGFGEDTILGWRVARQGQVIAAPDAVVRHAVLRPGVRELLWRAWLAGGFPTLVRECPELRGSMLSQGLFLGHRRLPMYATVLAMLAWRPAGLAAAVWWAASRLWDARRRSGPKQERLASVPVELAIDVVTAVALIWGSVRARRAVL